MKHADLSNSDDYMTEEAVKQVENKPSRRPAVGGGYGGLLFVHNSPAPGGVILAK